MSFDVRNFPPRYGQLLEAQECLSQSWRPALSRLRKFLTIVVSRAYESDGLICELTISCIKVRAINGYELQDPDLRVIMQVRITHQGVEASPQVVTRNE
jgi:hypothetical protein